MEKKYNGTAGNFQEVLTKFPLFTTKFPFFTSTAGGKKKTALPAIIAEENLPKMKIPRKVQTIPKHIYLGIDII